MIFTTVPQKTVKPKEIISLSTGKGKKVLLQWSKNRAIQNRGNLSIKKENKMKGIQPH